MKENDKGWKTQIPPTLSTTDPELDALRKVLGEYLVRVRPIPNGGDFLFSGPLEVVENAARVLAERETSAGAGYQVDMARLDEVFLLRLRGPRGSAVKIREYFRANTTGSRK